MTTTEFNSIRKLVYELTRINLADSKRLMLSSRLSRGLKSTGCASFAEYDELLRSLPRTAPEITQFINAVTTNTTHFFREPHHFEHVVNVLAPAILRRIRTGTPSMRIWHAGCSTGEEPYTLALALHEALPNVARWSIRQLATDIDTHALEVAAAGIYDREKLKAVPEPLQPKYFLRSRGEQEPRFKVKPALAEWVTFRQLNLLDDAWPFKAQTMFDAIFCRNVMIYFDRETQKTLIERFMARLGPGGCLYIGHSESLQGFSGGLRLVGQTTYEKASCLEQAA